MVANEGRWQPEPAGAELTVQSMALDILKVAGVTEPCKEEQPSEVVWLAEQANLCPVPAGWFRCEDEKGRILFVHENGAFPVQGRHPMLGYFVSLMSLLLAAKAGLIDEEQLSFEIDAAESRIAEEAEAISKAWAGPFKVGPDGCFEMWHCEECGWDSIMDPAAAPIHLLHVLDVLQEMVHSNSGYASEAMEQGFNATPNVLAVGADGKRSNGFYKHTPSTGVTLVDSSEGLGSSGCSEVWHSPMASPRSKSSSLSLSLQHRGSAAEAASCPWFNIGSPATSMGDDRQGQGSPASSPVVADHVWSDPDWQPRDISQNGRCLYYAMSPSEEDDLCRQPRPSMDRHEASGSLEVRTPDVRFNIIGDSASSSSDEVRPQRLDFTLDLSLSSPGSHGKAVSSEALCVGFADNEPAIEMITSQEAHSPRSSRLLRPLRSEPMQARPGGRIRAAGFTGLQGGIPPDQIGFQKAVLVCQRQSA